MRKNNLELNKTYNESCLDTLNRIPNNYLDCVVTSPPYWNLRDYGVNGQIGLEKTPEEYVEKMVQIFQEIKRALNPMGTVWLNLGDSYASGKGDCFNPGGGKESLGAKRKESGAHPLSRGNVSDLKKSGLKAKDLCGIPWRVAFALQADGWYLRSDIIWHKPNAMPESVTDRPTKNHEYIFLLTKSAKYYYDQKAILEPYTEPMNRWGGENLVPNGKSYWDQGTGQQTYRHRNMRPDPEGRNKRTVWTVTTKPFKEAHFAVYPPDLIRPCVLAGCPVGGIVYDPFMGSGTTAEVAILNNRKYIGSELNGEYIKLQEKRLGMFK